MSVFARPEDDRVVVQRLHLDEEDRGVPHRPLGGRPLAAHVEHHPRVLAVHDEAGVQEA